MRIAGAPISWGVCEVPGWGHQLAAQRVLAEMAEAGLSATEFGPDGFLPADPDQRAALLTGHGLTAVGGFVPVVLHRDDHDPVHDVRRALAGFGAADTLVLAAATGAAGYDTRPVLDAVGWRILLDNLTRCVEVAAGAGVSATLHPHVGTMIERSDEVDRLLADSDIGLCLDTGHLMVGGADPYRIARQAAHRITHVHLKDVDGALAEQVHRGTLGYTEAVRRGMYRPLGQGDVAVAGIVEALRSVDYQGWYVLEQDTVLDAEPPVGRGPLDDVRASVAHLRQVER